MRPKYYLNFFLCFITACFVSLGTGQAADHLDCPELDIQVKNNNISMDINQQPLGCVLEQLSQRTGVSITCFKKVKQTITLHLTGQPLETIFSRLAQGNALVYTYFPEKKEYRIIAATVASSDGHASEAEKDKNKKDIVKEKRYKSGELLIRFKKNVTQKQMEKLHLFIGSKVLESIERLRLHRVKIDPQLALDTAIDMYQASGMVKTAERHATRTIQDLFPNDPKFSQQWGLNAIKAPAAWQRTQGSKKGVIAVIDTGVDYLHPDLQKNIWVNQAEAEGHDNVDDDKNGYVDDIYGWNFADDNNQPLDTVGHGTHVAGTIGAVTDNSSGIAGVCPEIKIMSLKVQGEGDFEMDTFDIIEAVEYAKNKGVQILNCSFGGDEFQASEYEVFQEFQDANHGLMICSAGNDSNNIDSAPVYPASYDLSGIISVAASSKTSSSNYVLADFSNYGSTRVDVMAPGDSIISTIPEKSSTQAFVKMKNSLTQYPAQGFSFAKITDEDGISRSLIDCGYGYKDEIPVMVKDNIALIKRGSRDNGFFYFYQKIGNVQQKGAAGAVIYNNEPGDFAGTLVTPQDWITTVSVSQETGLFLKGQIPGAIVLVNKKKDDTVMYDQKSGTSMAAGFVSGAAGLLYSLYPEDDLTGLKNILLNTVEIIDTAQGRILTQGQINVFKALNQLSLAGDVNKDYQVLLHDSISCLKILSGKSSNDISPDIPYWDVNKDSRLEISEPIHILHQQLVE